MSKKLSTFRLDNETLENLKSISCDLKISQAEVIQGLVRLYECLHYQNNLFIPQEEEVAFIDYLESVTKSSNAAHVFTSISQDIYQKRELL